MLVLQFKTGEGAAGPPEFSPIIPDDPLVNNDFRIYDFHIKDDGTKIYVAGFKTPGTDTGYIHQYTMTTPWDVSTMVHDGASYIVNTTAVEKWISAIDFKPDGTQFFIGGQNNGKLHSYTLSTPWDLSTASFEASSATALAGSIQGLVVQPDNGSRVFITSPHTSNEIEEHVMSTHWDVTSLTGSPNGVSTTVGATASQTSGLYIRDNGTWWYVTSYVGDDINQHLSTFGYAPSTIAASLAEVDTTGQTTSPYGIFFKTDGKKMYVGDNVSSNVRIIQYDLGSSWLIASAHLS